MRAQQECRSGVGCRDVCGQRSAVPLHHIHLQLQLREHKGPPGRLCYPTLFLCRYPASTPCELTQLALNTEGWSTKAVFFLSCIKLHMVCAVCFFFPSCVSLSLAITLSTQTSNRKERERQSSRLRMIQTCSGHGSSVENKVLRDFIRNGGSGFNHLHHMQKRLTSNPSRNNPHRG